MWNRKELKNENFLTLNLPCEWALKSGRTDRGAWRMYLTFNSSTINSSSQFLCISVRFVNLNTGHFVLEQNLPFKGLPCVQLILLKQSMQLNFAIFILSHSIQCLWVYCIDLPHMYFLLPAYFLNICMCSVNIFKPAVGPSVLQSADLQLWAVKAL